MKVALSSYGKTWRDQIDIRFGRAGGFFVVDSVSEETSYIDNKENVLIGHEAGTSAAQHLLNADVDVLITGKIGIKAGEVLKSGSVKIDGGVGFVSVKEAYELFKKGRLVEQHQ